MITNGETAPVQSLSNVAYYLTDATHKRGYTRALFRIVAPRYDLVTRLLSFGRDQAWKKELIASLPDLNASRVVDIASGTGDLSYLITCRFPGARIVATDQSLSMLSRARRLSRTSSSLMRSAQDMGNIAVKTSSVDCCVGGYALRNAPALEGTIAEVWRILRPGGYGAFLDFSRADTPLFWWLQYVCLMFWGSLWGLLLHGDPRVYGYIAQSLRTFPSRTNLHALLRRSGFRIVNARRLFFGFAESVVVRKEPAG